MEYVTKAGDRWDSIANSQLGDVLLTTELMQANIEFVGTTIFPAGIILTIPEVMEQISSNLPPWKRDDD